MTIPLGRPSPGASCNRPGRQRGSAPGPQGPAIPIWSCSRWGLPCRRRCRRRGALLPHPFTLAAPRHSVRSAEGLGGLLSVALSLGLPPPGVTRHRASMEPGLSSPRPLRAESGHPAVWLGRDGLLPSRCQIDEEFVISPEARRRAHRGGDTPRNKAGTAAFFQRRHSATVPNQGGPKWPQARCKVSSQQLPRRSSS